MGSCYDIQHIKEDMEKLAESWSSESNSNFLVSLLEQSWNEAIIRPRFYHELSIRLVTLASNPPSGIRLSISLCEIKQYYGQDFKCRHSAQTFAFRSMHVDETASFT